ncbi:MAG: LysR family transcriptional regulator [Syntrophobacteraceae bacterium]|jgi:molybdate transport system regulatory protein|nr:LysR family transcriptional regulator [Syntrophobacteraceae bacterium]
MTGKPGKLTVRSKIWVEDEHGDVVFGSGRLHILNAVEEHGSILAAAKALGMSYRAVWGKIKATEDRLGQPLLTKRTGGAHGGGSELTPFARALIERFRHLDTLVRTTSDTLFEGVFMDAITHNPAGADASPPGEANGSRAR